MSTVLRPVGPHEPRVYWFRRAVVVVVIVAVIVAVIELLPGGGSAKPAAHHDSPAPTTSQSVSSPPPSTTTAACDPHVITLVLSTDSDTYTSGESPKLSGVFTNPSATSCTLATSATSEIWRVTSGPPTVWTTKGCTKSSATGQITLKSGATKTLSMVWNGRRLGPNCAVGAVAQAGEYVLRATLDGVKGVPAIFHITS